MSNLVGMMPNLVIDSCLYSKTTAKLRIFSEKRMAIYYFLSPEMSVSGFLPLPPGLFAAAGSSGPVPDACRQQIPLFVATIKPAPGITSRVLVTLGPRTGPDWTPNAKDS